MMGNQRTRISDLLSRALEDLSEDNFERFKDKLLHSDFKGKGNISQSRLEDATRIATKNLLLGFYGEDASVDVTIEVLIWINCRDVAAKLGEEREKDLGLNEKISEMSIEDYRVKYKEHIHREYQQIKDRNSRLGEGTLLNSRYTKLIIVNQYRPEKEREHEIMAMGQRHAEIMSEQARSSITINTLFRPERDAQAPRLVALVGAAGIGKTMTALKIMLDWATGKLYKKQFDYVYYINCREMTLLTQERSVADMILKSYPTNKAPIEHILANPEKILFVIDGFDELRFAFDQPESDLCSDPRKKQSVEIILNSLFRRTVLPECHLIITTRPTALGKLEKCSKCFRYAEILGFSEKERREYFQNFFENEKEASDAFNFVSKNEILFTMCFVPIVSWIICMVLKQQMDRGKDLAQTSKTITGVYLYYFLSLVESSGSNSKPQMQAHLRRLCSLAADGIWEQKILFEEEEIKKYGLDKADFLPLFLNENIFQRDLDCVSTYSFIHLSFQEFFAALSYALEGNEDTVKHAVTPKREVKSLLQEYGKSKNYLMLTVRFLFGLLNMDRRKDIEKKLGHKMSPTLQTDLVTWCSSSSIYSRERYVSFEILYCLYETQEAQFAKHALASLTDLKIYRREWIHMDQMVFSFIVKSHQELESLVFVQCDFNIEGHQDKEFLWLVKWFYQGKQKHSSIYPLCQALKDPDCKIKKLHFQFCKLKGTCCRDLTAVFSNNWHLKELKLYKSDLGYFGLKQLCEGLKQPDCKLQSLHFKDLARSGCRDLAAVLSTSPSLTQLELNSDLRDAGVQQLCQGLKNPNCKLQRLKLESCGFTSTGCRSLRTVLRSNWSLRELELSGNHVGDLGAQQLCEGLKDPSCHLQRLELRYCGLSAACCEDFAHVLINNPSLITLDLRGNHLGDSGVQNLCMWLKRPNCQLQKLCLWSCKLTVACCEDLTDVLRRNDSLRELQLGDNALGDSGVRVLCEGANHARLERLGLWSCRLTGACCGDLFAVLSTKQSLTELELGHNDVGDSGVRWLCEGLKHPNCKLQRLRLWWCKFTGTCCGDLAAVLRSNQSLAELELGGNEHLGDAGVQQLCEGLKHPNCKLQKLGLSGCDLTAGCCRELSSVLSTSQTLVELNLRDNQLGHSGVQLLCEGLKHPDCKLWRLRLSSHTFKEETRRELGAVKEIKAHLVVESN
ncbi:NACHT, LRR and PYD domains-containing protein 3-like [Alligator sinensis]|uniref:NACHT, LRR and PYD domains-containing protein 3 n=1 Tax=Alligator sinensis TaxID=38654 RepID=A0A3Q0HK37_ALLSI|nr:NACHT, LRR and PYD domains-containing protein 3-like [Alligator sinensis]